MSRPGTKIEPNGTINVFGRDVMNEMIVRGDQMGLGFYAPLIRAARDGQLCYVMAIGGERIPGRFFRAALPKVAVLGDDRPDAVGANGWAQAPKLMRWAKGAILHAAAGEPQHYALAAAMAVMCDQVLIIECETRHADDWIKLKKRVAPGLHMACILPPPGLHHPLQAAPAGVVVQ